MQLFGPGAEIFIRYSLKELWPDAISFIRNNKTPHYYGLLPKPALLFTPVRRRPRLQLCPWFVKVGVHKLPQLGAGRQVVERGQNHICREDGSNHARRGQKHTGNLPGGCRSFMSTKCLSSSKSLAVWTRCKMGPVQ